MNHKIIKGVLHRDGHPLQCPFATKMLTQPKGSFHASWIGSQCGTHCPLFQLHESKEPTRAAQATLSCGGCYVAYDVEVAVEETSHVPLSGPTLLKANA